MCRRMIVCLTDLFLLFSSTVDEYSPQRKVSEKGLVFALFTTLRQKVFS